MRGPALYAGPYPSPEPSSDAHPDVPQVYKMNLVDVRPPAGQAVDSARQNLANTFVNAFVNAGFGQV